MLYFIKCLKLASSTFMVCTSPHFHILLNFVHLIFILRDFPGINQQIRVLDLMTKGWRCASKRQFHRILEIFWGGYLSGWWSNNKFYTMVERINTLPWEPLSVYFVIVNIVIYLNTLQLCHFLDFVVWITCIVRCCIQHWEEWVLGYQLLLVYASWECTPIMKLCWYLFNMILSLACIVFTPNNLQAPHSSTPQVVLQVLHNNSILSICNL